MFFCLLLLAGWSTALVAADTDGSRQSDFTETAPTEAAAAAAAPTEASAAEPDAEAALIAAPSGPATAITPGSELESMTGPLIRMVLSLAAVLAMVGVFAWLAKRFRGGQLQGGLIQIVSGLSLGPKERVVLLRVGEEEILVGMSPAGMQQLHVLNRPVTKFSLNMADADGKD